MPSSDRKCGIFTQEGRTVPPSGLETALMLTPRHTTDSLETVRVRVSTGEAVLIDVREQAEWDAGHVSFAKLVPLSQLHANAESTAETLPNDTILYLHCRAGVRCLTAAAILNNAGYSVRPLKQGYRELQRAGFPVEART